MEYTREFSHSGRTITMTVETNTGSMDGGDGYTHTVRWQVDDGVIEEVADIPTADVVTTVSMKESALTTALDNAARDGMLAGLVALGFTEV